MIFLYYDENHKSPDKYQLFLIVHQYSPGLFYINQASISVAAS